MSWKMEVQTGSNDWTSNACAYATEQEAKDAGDELMSRWMLVTATRAVESDEEVNYRMVDGRPRSLQSLALGN